MGKLGLGWGWGWGCQQVDSLPDEEHTPPPPRPESLGTLNRPATDTEYSVLKGDPILQGPTCPHQTTSVLHWADKPVENTSPLNSCPPEHVTILVSHILSDEPVEAVLSYQVRVGSYEKTDPDHQAQRRRHRGGCCEEAKSTQKTEATGP